MASTRARGWTARTCALVVMAALAGGCSQPDTAQGPSASAAPDSNLAANLAHRVTLDGLMPHLNGLQQVADKNGGNRAEGSPGYDASVDYVSKLLSDKGFDVKTPTVSRLKVFSDGKPALTVGGRPYAIDQASFFVQTPKGGLTAAVARPTGNQSGCSVSDYGTEKLTGQLAVVNETGCSVVDKANVAKDRGAAGLLVIMPAGTPKGLFTPKYYEQLSIPVGIGDRGVDAVLRGNRAPVTLVLDMDVRKLISRSVVAQTATGDPANVVMAGAHLDSVPGSPGINDNGTGVAALLETALQLGARPAVNNAVRYAFWGAEEDGLAGSLDYTASLSAKEVNDIALYLNFDTLGSANAGYFVFDPDAPAAQSDPKQPPMNIAPGSEGIERTLAGYLNLAGVRPAATPFAGRSDYGPFMSLGIPVGGITSGAGEKMNAGEARKWHGRAGEPFDPNYHSPKDTIANVNKDALVINGSAVAFAIGTYALSVTGPNGVGEHKDRHRGSKPA